MHANRGVAYGLPRVKSIHAVSKACHTAFPTEGRRAVPPRWRVRLPSSGSLWYQLRPSTWPALCRLSLCLVAHRRGTGVVDEESVLPQTELTLENGGRGFMHAVGARLAGASPAGAAADTSITGTVAATTCFALATVVPLAHASVLP